MHSRSGLPKARRHRLHDAGLAGTRVTKIASLVTCKPVIEWKGAQEAYVDGLRHTEESHEETLGTAMVQVEAGVDCALRLVA